MELNYHESRAILTEVLIKHNALEAYATNLANPSIHSEYMFPKNEDNFEKSYDLLMNEFSWGNSVTVQPPSCTWSGLHTRYLKQVKKAEERAKEEPTSAAINATNIFPQGSLHWAIHQMMMKGDVLTHPKHLANDEWLRFTIEKGDFSYACDEDYDSDAGHDWCDSDTSDLFNYLTGWIYWERPKDPDAEEYELEEYEDD